MIARADKKTLKHLTQVKKPAQKHLTQTKKVHVKAPRTNQKSQHQNVTSKPKSRPKMISLKSTPACVKKD